MKRADEDCKRQEVSEFIELRSAFHGSSAEDVKKNGES